MANRDLANNLKFARGISATTVTNANTPFVSQIFDTADYDGVAFVIGTASLTDANATFAVTVDHGNNASLTDAAAVPAAQLTNTTASASFTFADDDNVRFIGYVGDKRYVRVTVTPTGNDSGSATLSGQWVASPKFLPAV
jgi:hypothetical protein